MIPSHLLKIIPDLVFSLIFDMQFDMYHDQYSQQFFSVFAKEFTNFTENNHTNAIPLTKILSTKSISILSKYLESSWLNNKQQIAQDLIVQLQNELGDTQDEFFYTIKSLLIFVLEKTYGYSDFASLSYVSDDSFTHLTQSLENSYIFINKSEELSPIEVFNKDSGKSIFRFIPKIY